MPGRGKPAFILTICFLLFVWSSAYIAISVGLESFKPGSLALLRFSVASLCLFIYALPKKISLPDIKDVPIILVCGFLGISVYHAALNYGRMSVTAGSASVILDSYPIFVALLSGIILREYVDRTKWIGILLSFVGIILIAIGENKGFGLSPGAFFILISAFSLSLFDVVQKKLLRKYKPLELTLYFFIAGTSFLSIFSIDLINQLKVASMSSVISGIYLGIVPGAVSYFTWAKLISKYPISTLSTTIYLVPPFTFLIAFLYLHEIPTTFAIIGGIVALLGVAIVHFSVQLRSIFIKRCSAFKFNYEFLIRKQ